MSAFSEWFTLQFGSREISSTATDEQLRVDIARGKAAQFEFDRRMLWDKKRDAALYAWQITDADRKKWAERAAARAKE